MKVYLVYQLYENWDDEIEEDLDKIFKNEVDAYNYAESMYEDDDNFRVEEWEVKEEWEVE